MRHSLGSGGYCGALASVLVAGLVADALADPGGGGVVVFRCNGLAAAPKPQDPKGSSVWVLGGSDRRDKRGPSYLVVFSAAACCATKSSPQWVEMSDKQQGRAGRPHPGAVRGPRCWLPLWSCSAGRRGEQPRPSAAHVPETLGGQTWLPGHSFLPSEASPPAPPRAGPPPGGEAEAGKCAQDRGGRPCTTARARGQQRVDLVPGLPVRRLACVREGSICPR